MARITTVNPESAPAAAGELLAAVKAKLGLVPNMTKVMANSPAALKGYLGFSGALGEGSLPAKVREQIAILVAEGNSCTYCLSAHTAIGKMIGLPESELAAAREGTSSDPKTLAALRFAHAVLSTTGEVTDDEVRAVLDAGWSEAQVAEIVANVALNVYTNLINKTFAVEVDFPVVRPASGVGA
ncbi:MAG: carboxymuconolactone decarboxylase family protein [Phycisphaerales bacterium]